MPLILGTNSIKDTGYNVANSIRFNGADSPALKRNSMGTATNRKKWTLSMWVKRSTTDQRMLASFDGAKSYFQFQSGGQLEVNDVPGSSFNYRLVTNAVYKDVSAWLHIVVAYDSTQGTDSNRLKLYVNGEEPTLGTATYPSQNFEPEVNSTGSHKYGSYDDSADYAFNGYFAEIVFIDGTQYAASDFGEFDSDSPNIWKPKDISGLTFGNNGHHLDFEDSSNLGNDANGGTDFDENNITATDQSTDTCTNNFATLNPLLVPLSYIPTYAEGNLQISAQSNSGRFQSISTIGVNSGKWYVEFRIDSSQYHTLGVCTEASFTTASTLIQDSNNYLGQSNTFSYIYYNNDGDVWASGTISSGYGDTITSAGDILGVALDLDNHKLYFSKNGVFQNSGNPTSGSTGTGAISIPTGHTYFFAVGDLATGSFSGTSVNFGSPSFSITSGNADDNGYGNFEYDVPAGYYALNTKNLAEFG